MPAENSTKLLDISITKREPAARALQGVSEVQKLDRKVLDLSGCGFELRVPIFFWATSGVDKLKIILDFCPPPPPHLAQPGPGKV